jgi:hypothetical protein
MQDQRHKALDYLGAEPLAGSGLEDEKPKGIQRERDSCGTSAFSRSACVDIPASSFPFSS